MIKACANLSAIVVLVALSTGCVSLDLSGLTEGGAFGAKPPKPTVPPGGPMVTVEFHSAGASKVKAVQLPLEPGMTVQDAVDKAKAGKHFRRVTIDLMRTHAQSGEPHKMQIAFDDAKDQVAHSTNYSLHPNDRLMVTENTNTVIDDMLSSFLGRSTKKR